MECKVEGVECEVQSAVCGECRLKCGVKSVEYVESVECGVWNVGWRVLSVKCRVCSANYGVGSGEWIGESWVDSVEWEMQSIFQSVQC